ncbi:tyrosine-type recombinase/integrase [Mycolicibacterium llatzerense]|uniref:tyrosine-type recombinase/integrase n=1 Tax=Mycolicibacterium llatzerense TaxID=280871 RepID=UPI0021B6C955|nr:tyrosine-type recombinase/integrase [Mycolicibacterium llatzerense]MCT7373373.1 hypothetical protein [Mycolicibacterium llatzerense]
MNTGKPKEIPATWRKLITAYLSYLSASDCTLSTIGTRRSHLAYMSRALGCTPRQVTEDGYVEWFGGEQHNHWSTETRRSYRNTFNGFYRWAYKKKHVRVDLSYSLPRVRARKPMPRPTPEDVRQDAHDDADDRVRLMLELCDYGLRRGEVAVVSTDDLMEGLEGPRLLVHGKGRKLRIIPITPELATRIRAGAAGHTPGAPTTGHLFPGSVDGHLSPRWVGTLCARVMPGIWTMHSLRHRTATRAYGFTHDIISTRDLLGHASSATSEMYILGDEGAVRLAMLAAVKGPAPAARIALLPTG